MEELAILFSRAVLLFEQIRWRRNAKLYLLRLQSHPTTSLYFRRSFLFEHPTETETHPYCQRLSHLPLRCLFYHLTTEFIINASLNELGMPFWIYGNKDMEIRGSLCDCSQSDLSIGSRFISEFLDLLA